MKQHKQILVKCKLFHTPNKLVNTIIFVHKHVHKHKCLNYMKTMKMIAEL